MGRAHACQNDFASLPVSLPRLANSFSAVTINGAAICVRKKIEFASLPRFLSRGGSEPANSRSNWRTGHTWPTLAVLGTEDGCSAIATFQFDLTVPLAGGKPTFGNLLLLEITARAAMPGNRDSSL